MASPDIGQAGQGTPDAHRDEQSLAHSAETASQ